MEDHTEPVPVRAGWEGVAEAAAELRAWRGERSLGEVAALVGAKGPQWFEWERCHEQGYARPGGDYRDKLELVTGIDRARWRTADEQASVAEVAARVAAAADDMPAGLEDDGPRVVRDGFSQVEG